MAGTGSSAGYLLGDSVSARKSVCFAAGTEGGAQKDDAHPVHSCGDCFAAEVCMKEYRKQKVHPYNPSAAATSIVLASAPECDVCQKT